MGCAVQSASLVRRIVVFEGDPLIDFRRSNTIHAGSVTVLVACSPTSALEAAAAVVAADPLAAVRGIDRLVHQLTVMTHERDTALAALADEKARLPSWW